MDELTTRQETMLTLIREANAIGLFPNSASIAARLGFHPGTLWEDFERLIELGLVHRTTITQELLTAPKPAAINARKTHSPPRHQDAKEIAYMGSGIGDAE